MTSPGGVRGREGKRRRGAQAAVAPGHAGQRLLSSACDGWQPVEAQWRLTRRCCELLLERGFQLHVLTKSALVLRDLDIFVVRPVQIGVTLTTLDERLRELWEPGAASIDQRLRVIEAARQAGIETSVMFGPLLPFLSDSQAAIEALLGRAADLGIDRIWVRWAQCPASGMACRGRVAPHAFPRVVAALPQDFVRQGITGRIPQRAFRPR